MTIIPFPDKHTCCGAKTTGWLTLPVAPRASARSRFCSEEKLPQALPPHGALTWLDGLVAKGKVVSGVELDGPGDPMAQLAPTLDTLALLKQKYPELAFRLTTLGFGLAENAALLAGNGVSRVAVLMDALDPKVVQRLYLWIRPGKRNVALAKASVSLIDEQARAITACKAVGMAVSVKTTVYAGVNEREVEGIARYVAGLGAESITLVPGKGSLGKEEVAQPPDEKTMQALKASAAQYIEVLDLPQPVVMGDIATLPMAAAMPKPIAGRPNVAVVSSNGMDIDLHLGQAIKILIYGPRGEDGLACLLETRPAPEPGGGSSRWQKVAEVLPDCFALLAASAGENPRKILGQEGIGVVITDDEIEGVVDVLYGGKKGRNK